MKLKISSQKLIALMFIFLMFISSLAFAIMKLFSNQDESISIPKQKIIDYELKTEQRKYLLERGYTLIEYRYYTGCLDCIDIKKELERITQNSDGQIFLQEILSEDRISRMIITSLRGNKNLDDPSVEQMENTICDLLINQPLWCVSSKI